MQKPFYIYIDVDETFLRNYGAKQIPIPHMLEHIKRLNKEGAVLYCWSSGGALYAKEKAQEFGIAECFEGFLPKPMVVVDDMKLSSWRNLIEVHPNECNGIGIEKFKKRLL